MSSHKDDEPVFEVKPGDVTIGGEGKVEIINARLAEMVKAAVRLEQGAGGAGVLRAADNYGCGTNFYQCKPAVAAEADTATTRQRTR